MSADGLAQAELAAGNMTPTNRRFRIMGLLFVTVVINYLDRSNISIAAPSLAADFHLDPVQLGLVFSAFSWTYTPFQLPGGWLVDRVHPRVLYPVIIMLWSLATLTLGLADGLVMLIALRMAVGFFEVPTFLINNRIATTWFGEKERATRRHHRDLGAGDVATLAGQQEQHEPRHLFGGSHALHRRLLRATLVLLRGPDVQHLRVDRSGMHRVHPYPARREFDRGPWSCRAAPIWSRCRPWHPANRANPQRKKY